MKKACSATKKALFCAICSFVSETALDFSHIMLNLFLLAKLSFSKQISFSLNSPFRGVP